MCIGWVPAAQQQQQHTVTQHVLNRQLTRAPRPTFPLNRESGDPAKARAYFPADKQYLVTRGGE